MSGKKRRERRQRGQKREKRETMVDGIEFDRNGDDI